MTPDPLRALSFLATSTFALFAGCGGATVSGGAPDAGATSPDSAAPSPDGGASLEAGSTGCPSAAPAAGAGCTGTLVCEYGSDPAVSCDIVARCESGQWTVTPPAGGAECATTSAPECPASFADLSTQDACHPVDALCFYPQARCSCATHCGMTGVIGTDGGPLATWCCLAGPSGQPGCPTLRPRIGTACSAPKLFCDYGGCNGNVSLECTDGLWQPEVIACPG
jgi:hypothetical protein